MPEMRARENCTKVKLKENHMDFEKSLLHKVESGAATAGEVFKEATEVMAEYGGTPSSEFVEALASLGLVDENMSSEEIIDVAPVGSPLEENIEVIVEEAVPAVIEEVVETVDMTPPLVEEIVVEPVVEPIEEMGAPEEPESTDTTIAV
jgi:hypothetical protein